MKKPRILVVDDEVAFTNNISKLFSKRGHEVLGVYDGESGIRALEEKDLDVVILDMKMPGLDGIATLKEMKKRKPLVEVIILTGHGSVESGIEGLQYGAFDYIMKPLHLGDLNEKVNDAFQRKLIMEERLRESELVE